MSFGDLNCRRLRDAIDTVPTTRQTQQYQQKEHCFKLFESHTEDGGTPITHDANSETSLLANFGTPAVAVLAMDSNFDRA